MTQPLPRCATDPLHCDPYELLDWLSKVSGGMPHRYNSFTVLTVRNGSRDSWAREVKALAGELPDGYYVAGAHMIGSGPYNELVEVLGPDQDAVTEFAFKIIDREEVLDARFLPFGRDEQVGMGRVVDGM